MKVNEFLNNWLKTYGKYNLKATTLEGYRMYIRNYINPNIGSIDLEILKPLDLQNFYYDMLENGRIKNNKPLNPKSVLQAHRIIHKALKNAVMLQIITSNPADFVELPRKRKFKYTILTGDDLKEFVDSFKNTRVYIPIILILALGLRRGELLALKFKDFKAKDNILVIDKTVVVANRVVKIDTPKTESSIRSLLLSEDIKDFINNIQMIKNSSNEDYVITNINNQRCNPDSFSRLYTSIRDRKKLPKVRFHDLRHIHATLLYQNGVKEKLIQERLGHSNISTTLDIYTHLFKEDQKEVINVLKSLNLVPTDF